MPTCNNPPQPNTRYYNKIIKIGCGGHYDYYGEFDCLHHYAWSCEDCPIVVDKMLDDLDQPVEMFQLE